MDIEIARIRWWSCAIARELSNFGMLEKVQMSFAVALAYVTACRKTKFGDRIGTTANANERRQRV